MAVAGHPVGIYNTQEPDSLKSLAQELGVSSSTSDEIEKNVDVLILSVPTTAIPQLPNNWLADLSDDVIVVDTSNYYPFRDGEIEELKNGQVEGVWVTETPGRPVAKAFNKLLAHS